jgi:hypothetical protein
LFSWLKVRDRNECPSSAVTRIPVLIIANNPILQSSEKVDSPGELYNFSVALSTISTVSLGKKDNNLSKATAGSDIRYLGAED